ncbi:hypothetical protein GALMADRAFT_56751 [Galerina marginata CBS 339.88]|uniref:Uncharacterized protein n=1 Tax=Galerina marginata (strain CBS 339.88) TaxID=685588 RepID=A0A067TRH5_GALM3|nr:hypothetical protein GALMADRAFT_56751 [Galerina marginata CBS 339.88]
MPLPSHLRKRQGSLSIVPTVDEFKHNWRLFTHGILDNICWHNVVAAGGSVLACLEPFEGNATLQQKNRRYQPIQIILRLYLSPAEILAGFDVDSACFAFDGHCVWSNPRGLASCIRQANTVDLSRRSPSYEVRLAKYAERGYEVYLPSLLRQRIDPLIFHCPSPKRPNGLARLLVLERLYFKDAILGNCLHYPWKLVLALGAVSAGPGRQLNIDFQSSDYDIAWVIPYGPSWTAQKIAKSVASLVIIASLLSVSPIQLMLFTEQPLEWYVYL